MNNQTEIASRTKESHALHAEGYIYLLSTPTIFEMDLVGKNLQMNGIDVKWFYPDSIDHADEPSALFVKPDQQENARSILASLDLTDFITLNGK